MFLDYWRFYEFESNFELTNNIIKKTICTFKARYYRSIKKNSDNIHLPFSLYFVMSERGEIHLSWKKTSITYLSRNKILIEWCMYVKKIQEHLSILGGRNFLYENK